VGPTYNHGDRGDPLPRHFGTSEDDAIGYQVTFDDQVRSCKAAVEDDDECGNFFMVEGGQTTYYTWDDVGVDYWYEADGTKTPIPEYEKVWLPNPSWLPDRRNPATAQGVARGRGLKGNCWCVKKGFDCAMVHRKGTTYWGDGGGNPWNPGSSHETHVYTNLPEAALVTNDKGTCQAFPDPSTAYNKGVASVGNAWTAPMHDWPPCESTKKRGDNYRGCWSSDTASWTRRQPQTLPYMTITDDSNIMTLDSAPHPWHPPLELLESTRLSDPKSTDGRDGRDPPDWQRPGRELDCHKYLYC
jgi:hypothetical protein